MDIHMDTGDIIKEESIKIEDCDTYQTLHDKLSLLGAKLLIETLPDIINKKNQRIKQIESEATYGYNITREEEKINFNEKLDKVYNQIRGLNPTPGSYFLLDNKIVKVYDVRKIETNSYKEKENGEIVKIDNEAIYVKVLDGLIKILEIKIEGKNKMPVTNFLNGNKNNLVGKILNRSVV